MELSMRASPASFLTLTVGALLLTGAFCADPAPAPEGGERSASLTAEPTPTADPPTVTVEESDEPSPVTIAEVAWDEADEEVDRIHASRIPEASLERARRSPIPVLLPDDDALLATAQITAGPTWYAVSMQATDHTVSIHGTNAVHELPGMGQKEEPSDPPDGPVLSRTHGIVHVAFQAFGAAYSLDIDCQDPLENPHCTDDDYALSLVESAAVLDLEP
jgi:hypothetical protein